MRRVVLLIAIPVAVVALLAVAAVGTGFVRLPGAAVSERPPCDQLPDRATVADALTERTELVRKLEDVGEGVRVRAITPCADEDRSLVEVGFSTGDEREGIDQVLQSNDGFGVPVQLVRI